MDQRSPFRFLTKEEFNKLSQGDKVVYISGATAELQRRGEELRDYMRHIGDKHFPPGTPKS